MMKKYFLLMLSILTLNSLKAAEHGISMHGDLKYKPNFSHYDYVNPNAPKGGKIKFSVVGTFNTLNPFAPKGTPPAGLSIFTERLVYDQLMSRSADEPFSLYGLIAESVEMAPDRSSITFHLNPKAAWADGKPITADDVIFTHGLLKEKGMPNVQLFYSKVDRIEKLSERSVKLTFKPRPEGGYDPEAPMLMALMTVLPKHALEGREFEKITMEPILGSGPYEVAEVKPGHSITYKRRTNYWGNDLNVVKGRFNFDEVHFEYYRNAQVELEAFKAGEFDVRSENDLVAWQQDYNFPAVKEGKVAKIEFQHTRPVGMKGFAFNTRRPFFSDIRVREALTYAFDFEWLNKTLFKNQYKRTESYFANTFLASLGIPEGDELKLLENYRKDLPAALFNTEYHLPVGGDQLKMRTNFKKATALLKEAGWVIQQGVLVHQETKQPFKFEILLYRPDDEKIALAYARNLKHLGIQVSIRSIDAAQYEQRMSNYDFDMTLHTWGHTLFPGNEQKFYWRSQGVTEPNTRNYSGINSAIIDALCENVANAKDKPTLTTAIHALDRVLLWGYYALPLYYSNKIYLAYWNKFGHPEINPDVGIYFTGWWSKSAE